MKKIVIIDDSAPFTLLIKQLLETEDVIVESYEDAGDFLKIPSRITGYDLIILDIHLPDVDGLHVLENLKNKPATKDIPVLLLSGDSRSEMVIRGMRMGAIDFMTKPIDPAQLIERVLDHLDRGIDQS
ncbi:response regulator [Paenibacillus sp. PK4536]|jgi:DNA-binding response OmpR family regulator|uniref:Gliding motility regulatory protein n=1 Tax=Paenibacillus nuruki TaxID=1886670 RepID=A0A1E3KYA5_9BACL|nr:MULTISPECIES: response regulator [Paenibacillus]ODP26454.1 Gliding motility regulatory protein [Paenibacillus nuruki]WIM40682.1 response regulator [Paenibacillus sp. PK4536]CAJ1316969.1 Gliding motility regulatory protein [Paenibacillus nuruki]